MQFFDDKQEVMDVIITPFGKHLLSQGRFKPQYYAFFDEDILYDSLWISGSVIEEPQNTIEGRIQHETPRIKQQSVYTGIETAINIRNDIIRTAIAGATYDTGSYVVQDTHNHAVYNKETLQQHGDRFSFLSKPLGRSAIASKYLPAWNVSMLKGAISSSQGYFVNPQDDAQDTTGSIENIPQININLNYKIYVNEVGPEYQWTIADTTVAYTADTFPVQEEGFEEQDVSDVFPPSTIQDIASEVFGDGTYFTLQNGKIIIDLLEENVDFKKENFDIQVFASGSLFNSVNNEPQQLLFSNALIAPQGDDVEKYLTIRVDRGIDDARISRGQIKNLTALTTDSATTNVISTREFLVRDLYDPEEDICE